MTTQTKAPMLANFAFTSCEYGDFYRGVHLVPIVKGSEQDGHTYWQCQNNYEEPNAIGSLRRFIDVCAKHYEFVTGQSLARDERYERDEFVTSSVQNLLSSKTQIDPVIYFIGPSNSCLILYRADSGPLVGMSRDTIIGLTWHMEQDSIAAAEQAEKASHNG